MCTEIATCIITEDRSFYLLNDGQVADTLDGIFSEGWPSLYAFVKDCREKQIGFAVEFKPIDHINISTGLKRRLKTAFELVEDELKQSLRLIREGKAEESWFYEEFPPRYRRFATEQMCQKFLDILSSLRSKALGQTSSALNCRAEELLLSWVIEGVNVWSDMQGRGYPDREAEEFREEIYDDWDYMYLYDDAFDGIELIEKLRIGPMSPNTWFDPFR